MLLGGRNGWLYHYDAAARSDQVDAETAVAIESHVWLGPGRYGPSPDRPAVLTRLSATLPASSDAVDFAVCSGADAGAVLAAAPAAQGSWAAGHNVSRPRVRAAAHGVRLSNAAAGKAWWMDSAAARFEEGGNAR